MLSKSNPFRRSPSLLSSPLPPPSFISPPFPSFRSFFPSPFRLISQTLLLRNEAGKESTRKDHVPWTGSGFGGASSSSDMRGNLAQRDDVREGNAQAKKVAGKEETQPNGRAPPAMKRVDPRRNQFDQHQSRRPFSSSFVLSRNKREKQEKSFEFDERGKQVTPPRPQEGAEKIAASADAFPKNSPNPPSEKDSSNFPGSLEFPSKAPEEVQMHFGKDYSGTPTKDLSSTIKEGLDESVKVKNQGASSSSSSSSSSNSSPSSATGYSTKLSEIGSAPTSASSAQADPKKQGKEPGTFGKEAGNPRKGDDKGREERKEERKEKGSSFFGSLGSSLKAGLKTIIGSQPHA